MEVKLKAEPRHDSGKGSARQLRAAGRVPGVLYGHGMEARPLSVDALDLLHVLHRGTNVLIDLKLDSETHLTLAREVQRDHIKGRLVHVDFLAIRKDEKITVSVAIKPVGESHGVKEGGVVEHHMWEVEVECLPLDVPEALEADIADLGIGDSLHVRDLKIPPKVEVLTSPDEMVLGVVQPQARGIEEEEAAAAAAAEEAEAAEGEAAEGEAGAAAKKGPAEPAGEGGED